MLERVKLKFPSLALAEGKKEAVTRAIKVFEAELVPMREFYSKYGIELP